MSTNERNLITYQNHLLPCSHFTPLLAASTGYAPLSHSHFHSHCATHICVSAFVIALFISRLLAHNNKLGWPWHGLRIVVIVVVVYCLFANLRLGWGRAGRLAVAVVVVVAILMLMRGNNKWQQVFIESNSNKNNNNYEHTTQTSHKLPPSRSHSININRMNVLRVLPSILFQLWIDDEQFLVLSRSIRPARRKCQLHAHAHTQQ